MFEIFHDINWILLGALIIVSALVSWAGDVIGMKLGKKRITFLKLRPKYTSRIISVLTGVGIAIATIFVLSTDRAFQHAGHPAAADIHERRT